MRSVDRDLRRQHMHSDERRALFFHECARNQGDTMQWNSKDFSRRFKQERQYTSRDRVKVTKNHQKQKIIPAKVAYQRVREASIRSAKRMKSAQQEVNATMAPLLCYGLLKTEAKYQQVRQVNSTLSKGKGHYGISLPRQPTVQQVKVLAEAVYKNPNILSNAPDWVLRYRKGRLQKAGNILARPNQQVTLTKMDHTKYPFVEDAEAAIHSAMAEIGMNAIAMRIKKGRILDKIEVAAVVYFETAYHARCALYGLSKLGRVHLGQTVATARVVASKVQPTIELLLTEADGRCADELTEEKLSRVASILGVRSLPLQLWIDKDGRVTFIKLKIIDTSYQFFKKGQSRVINLLEYIGDEAECRQFIPHLVDQFSETNAMTFHLPNGLAIKVILVYISGDHKSLYAQTGREGGNDQRDQFSHRSMASMFHRVLYQGPVIFTYTDFIEIWTKINDEMKIVKAGLMVQNKSLTDKREAEIRNQLYRTHGRIDRVPAFMNGVRQAQPRVTDNLVITPLNLHNDTYGTLITMELVLPIVDPKSTELKRIRARQKGLLDGFGQKKCTQSGEGIRRLLHDCLDLELDIIPTKRSKYSGILWLKDTISYHLRLTDHTNFRPLALEDHERLKFASCTLLWWLLIGDLSSEQGGRTLKSGKTKNHLEDKVYPYETAHACVEFEERIRVPLSLVNEAAFEATFVFRDELIEAFRSKVALENERLAVHFKHLVNAIAPKRQYRSIMSGMSRHVERDIIILGCWKGLPKWSFNIRRMLLRRFSKLSYRRRVSICTSGDFQHTIKLKAKTENKESNFYAHLDPTPPVIIDPCGQCDHSPSDEITFCRSLNMWHFLWKLRGIKARQVLYASYSDRLRTVNIQRAQRIRLDIEQELKNPKKKKRKRTEINDDHDSKSQHVQTKSRPSVKLIQRLYKGYLRLQRRWPCHIASMTPSPQLRAILERSTERKAGPVWHGDLESISIQDIVTFKKAKLKSIIRFFQARKIQKGLTLRGNKKELQGKVRELLTQYPDLLNSLHQVD